MSKIRIYELAKELGVDNKVVITRAIELGMSGKASHSNSLDADEADQIRRSLIRQAMGAPAQSEVVTRRVVDKTTGQTEAIVERRQGNVIRRRKQTDEEAQAATAVSDAEAHASMNGGAAHTELEDYGDGLSAKAREEEEADTESEPQTSSELGEVGDESPAIGKLDVAAEAIEEEVVDDDGKKVGPRVLGRIELPQRKVPSKVEGKVGGVAVGKSAVAATVFEDEDEEAKKRDKVKKTRKREISRIDLVDYEGRDLRRGPKPTHRSQLKDRSADRGQLEAKPKTKSPIKMSESITVGELAKQMSLKAGEIIAKLIELGIMATINQAIDFTTASLIAEDMGYEIESTSFDESKILVDETKDEEGNVAERPPVVTVMGHVDHGKTSLLDSIRNATVAEKEHGGITQHIGAYSVDVNGKKITFIDTPGHAAFTAMRARGATVTDLVVLVVAADDGVMPQTIEAINHARAAQVPIVVAVNKMDKYEANADRVKQQLTEHGLQPEDWGGDTMYFGVSALKGTGIKELLEGILLLAEVKELKANPDTRASGTIIESKQEIGKGAVATVLVQRGTLQVGDIFVTGAQFGRVRAMTDHQGKKVTSAGPSTPVEITGMSEVPSAGDDFFVVESEAKAREVSDHRAEKRAEKDRSLATGPITLEEFARRANNLTLAELNIILKADVDGSVDAVRTSIEKLSTEKVKVRVLHAAVGGVTESDIQLAAASNAIVIGFGVRAEPRAMAIAERSGIEIRFYRIIYELIDDVKKAMVGLLDPIKEEVNLGRVEVRETFNVPKAGTVAGCYVVDGMVKRGAFVRLVRDSRVVHEGKMSSLRRFKDDVREVQSGYECGIGLEGYNDVKTGDVFEVYEFKEVAPTLD